MQDLIFSLMIRVMVLWVATPLRDGAGYQCFRGPCCLHSNSQHGGSMVGL